MKLLIVGATGGTGRAALKEAKAVGHTVTVFVRDPGKLPEADTRDVRVVIGSLPDDEALLTETMRGQQAVISTLGRGRSFKANDLIKQCVPPLLRAMTQARVKRLVFTSAFGLGDTWQDAPLGPRIFIKTLLRGIYADKRVGESLIRQSQLDWTLVHPTGLSDGPRTGTWRSGEHLELRGMPRISRADAAAFLVLQVNDSSYLHKTVLVSY